MSARCLCGCKIAPVDEQAVGYCSSCWATGCPTHVARTPWSTDTSGMALAAMLVSVALVMMHAAGLPWWVLPVALGVGAPVVLVGCAGVWLVRCALRARKIRAKQFEPVAEAPSTVRVIHHGCSGLELSADMLSLHLAEPGAEHATYSFRCPVCAEDVTHTATPDAYELLANAGVRVVHRGADASTRVDADAVEAFLALLETTPDVIEAARKQDRP